jgi:hypothetical protein
MVCSFGRRDWTTGGCMKDSHTFEAKGWEFFIFELNPARVSVEN